MLVIGGARTRLHASRSVGARRARMRFFGVLALTMMPLELTTPDLLSDAAIFVRVRRAAPAARLDRTPHARRRRPRLALGLGALAKSFLVPWGVVCFATLAVAVRTSRDARDRDRRGLWLLFVAPWTARALEQGWPSHVRRRRPSDVRAGTSTCRTRRAWAACRRRADAGDGGHSAGRRRSRHVAARGSDVGRPRALQPHGRAACAA